MSSVVPLLALLAAGPVGAAGAAGAVGTVGIHIEHIEGLSSDQGDTLAGVIAEVAEVAARRPTKLDSRGAGPCGAKDTCAREVRVRTGASTVLFVSAYGGISKIAVFLELHDEGAAPKEKRVDLEITEKSWRPTLTRALSAFLPKGQRQAAPPAQVERPGPPPIRAEDPPAVQAGEPGRPVVGARPEPKREPRRVEPPRAKAGDTPKPAALVAETEPSKEGAGSGRLIAGITLTSAGAALAIAGTVMIAGSYASQSALFSEFDRRDETDHIVGIDYRSAVDEADSIGMTRTIGVVLGAAGAAAITGGILWLLGGDDEPTPVRGALLPAQGGGGLTLSGTF